METQISKRCVYDNLGIVAVGGRVNSSVVPRSSACVSDAFVLQFNLRRCLLPKG